jgi:hypothetical protein
MTAEDRMQLAFAVAVRVIVVMAIVGVIGYLVDKSQGSLRRKDL